VAQPAIKNKAKIGRIILIFIVFMIYLLA